MDLRDFEAFGEPGAMVYLADCVDLMKIMPPASVDMIFADPPYRLSNGGVTVKNGRRASVDKGAWDRSMGFPDGPPLQRRMAAGGAPHPQARRNHLGYGHAPHHLQPRLRAPEHEFQANKPDHLGQTRPTPERPPHRLHPRPRNIAVGEQEQGSRATPSTTTS